MDCTKCKTNGKCKKPWESEESYQIMYLGRTYTKEQWEKEGECTFFERIKEPNK